MHEILIQQLIRHFGSLDRVPESLRPLLADINRTYAEGRPAHAARQSQTGASPASAQTRTAAAEKSGNGQTSGTVAIPIQLRGQTLGAINLSFENPEAARSTAPLVQQLSNRLALAMDNARLFQETQNALGRTNALLEVSRAAMGSASPTDLMRTTAEVITRTLGTDRTVIRRIDAAHQQILEAVGAGPGVGHSPLQLPFADLMDGLHGWVLAEQKPARSPKDQPDPRDSEATRRLRKMANCGAILVVPLLARGTVIGMITAINTPEQPDFSVQDEELLVAMANQVTTALENAQLITEQERQLQELSVLFEGSRTFALAPIDLVEASAAIAQYFRETTGANRAAVGLYRAEDEFVHFLAEATHIDGVDGMTPDPSIWDYSLEEYPFTRRTLELRAAASVSLGDAEIDPAEKKFLLENEVQTLVIIPLASKGQTIGVIELEYATEARSFTQDQLRYFDTLANQAAATLDNLQLLQVQQQRALELQTAAEVSRAASSILDVETLLPQTVELIRSRFDLYYAGIFLVDEAGEWAVLRAGTGEAGRIQLEQNHRLQVGGQSMIGRCVSTGQAQIALDIGEAAVRFQNPVLPETRSEMALPLLARGETIGAMTIQSTRPAAFTQENITTLQTMADQLANAIENARLFAQAQLQNRELDTLNEMGRALTAQFDRDSIAENILTYTTRLMDFNSFLLAFYEGEQDQLTFPLVVENNQRLSIPTQPLGQGLVAYVVRQAAPLLVAEDLEGTAARLGIQYTTVGEVTESWLGVPMIVGGEVVGVISVQSTTTPRLYSERSRDLLISIANQASNALQISILFEQARRQAEELSVLNEMGRALSIQLSVDDICEVVYTYATRLLGTPNLFIATYEEETQLIDFRLAVTDQQVRLDVPSRKLGSGLTDYVIHTRTPLLFKENAEQEIERLGLQGITIGDPPLSWLAVPILLGDSVVGVVGTQSVTTPGKFSERHRDLLVAIASQAAIAMLNAALFGQAQQQSRDLAVLNEMSRELPTQLDLPSIVEKIYGYTSRLLGTQDVFIALYDAERERITFPFVVDDGRRIDVPDRPLGAGPTDHVIRTQQPLVLAENADARLEELGMDSVLIGEPPQSWLGVPILLGSASLGMIGTQSVHAPQRYSSRQVDLITSIAGQAAITLQNANLFSQAQRQNEDLLVLNEMSRELATRLDVQEIVETVYTYTGRLLDASNFYLALFDDETGMIRFPLATIGSDGERIELPERPLQNGLTDYIIRNQTPLLFKRYDPQDHAALGIDLMTFGDDRPALSWLGVPMLSGGRTLGVISVQSTEAPGVYAERDRDLLTAIASQAVSAIQNARSFAQSQRQAEELAVLNEMGRVLTTLLDEQEVVETIYTYTSQLMDTASFFVAFYEPASEEITFPLVYTGGRRLESMAPRRLGNGLTDYVLRNQSSLLLSSFSEERLAELGIDLILFGNNQPPQSWLGVPMRIGSRLLGAIVIQSVTTAGLFQERHRDLLTSISNQASNAIQNARLFGQTQRQNRDLAVLNEMSRVLAATLSVDEVVSSVYTYASRVLDTSIFHMVLYDAANQTIRYPLVINHGERMEVPPRPFGNRGLTEHIINTRQPLLLAEDVPARMEELGLETVYLGDESVPLCWMGVPMTIGPQVIGTITLQSTSTPRKFGEYERDLLTSIAGQAAIAIQNARLFGETQKRAAQLQTAAEVARDASESLNLDELLPRTVDLIRDRFGFYHSSIFLLDDSRENAYVRASTGEAGRELISRRHLLPVGSQSIIGAVTAGGVPLVVNDVTQDVIHRPNPLLPDTRAELGIPLKIGERVIGALDVQSTEIDAFSPEDVAVLQTLADQIAVAVDNSRTFELAQEAFREARTRAQEMSSLYDVSRQLTSSALETREIVQTALSAISGYLGENISCSISLYEAETGMMRTLGDQQMTPAGPEFNPKPERWDFRLDDYPATRRVMESLEPEFFRLSDPEIDPAERSYLEDSGAFSLLIVPLAVKGESLGVLEIEAWDRDAEITPAQIPPIRAMANQTAAALENALLYSDQLRTAEQLRELDTLKNQFLANMSHELRTPLNSIIGFSRVILKGIDGPVTDLQQQDLNAIYNAGQHLLGLINDILDLSRIEAGKMELNFEELNIEGLISSVMATARGLVKEKRINLETHIEPDLPPVQADATRIRQILLNLLQNAAKFTEEGHIRVRAERMLRPNGVVYVQVSVEDTGIGIAPEDQARLFQPFTQIDSSTTRRAGGTGLGLSISRNLIDLHGGEIGVTSEPGVGSTFFFTLPVRQDARQITPTGERKVVLAIDDDPRVIDLYERYLDSQGYQVIALSDPSQAVEQATAIRPFAITLDVMMPSKNGWQVIQDLKASEATRDIPVIFCTIIDDEARGFSLGAADYLLKPILEEDLINALVRLEANREIHTVLAIDDDPDTLRLVEKTLKPTGMYDLYLAQGGEKGLQLLREKKPDVVLLDLLMDDLDGFKIIEEMQQDAALKDIPVIVVTGYELTAKEHESIASYTYNLIRKGNLKEDQLIDKIAEILRSRNSGRNGKRQKSP